jgi:hypothetical protein
VSKTIERLEDMTPTGRLRLLRQDDGDVIVIIIPDAESHRPMVSVEFCTPFAGGGQSEHTWEALGALMAAMERDEKERSQNQRRADNKMSPT